VALRESPRGRPSHERRRPALRYRERVGAAGIHQERQATHATPGGWITPQAITQRGSCFDGHAGVLPAAGARMRVGRKEASHAPAVGPRYASIPSPTLIRRQGSNARPLGNQDPLCTTPSVSIDGALESARYSRSINRVAVA